MGDPRTLQNKVFFEIMLYFCRRGRQNLRELKIKDFSSAKDDKGARYVTKSSDELTKNRREDDEGFEGGMMFEKLGPQCPVASLELYIKHLNTKNEFLFQRPKKGSKIGVDHVCFDNMVVGEHTLCEKMKCISKEAEFSNHSNHSIRATAVTILDKCGYEARHIMAVSGHKSESSIQSYCKADTSMKKQMSESMAAATSTVALPESNVQPSPLLSLSQEEFFMRDVSVSTSTTQVSKTYNFSNGNVIFNN